MADDKVIAAFEADLNQRLTKANATACNAIKPTTLPTLDLPTGVKFKETSTEKPREVQILEAALSEPYKQYAGYLVEAGSMFGVSPVLLWAIMDHESGGKQGAVRGIGEGNVKGRPSWVPGIDHGLMQINYVSHKAWFAANHDTSLDDSQWILQPFMDPRINIQKGAQVLAAAIRFFMYRSPISKAYTEIRPLYGDALLRAGLSGYAGGVGRVLTALLKGESPDTATPVWDLRQESYADRIILKRANPLRVKIAQIDSAAGEAQNMAMLSFNPKPDGSASTSVAIKMFAEAEARRRSEKMATSPRDVYYAENARMRLQQVSKAVHNKVELPAGVKLSSIVPVPFTSDANLRAMTYDWKTGLWGDGKPV